MKEWIAKLKGVEEELSRERGQFTLFAPILHTENIGKWRILVAASWADDTYGDSLRLILDRIREKMTWEEYLRISAVILLSTDSPLVRALTSEFDVQHGNVAFQNRTIEGVDFEEAIIITATPQRVPVPA